MKGLSSFKNGKDRPGFVQEQEGIEYLGIPNLIRHKTTEWVEPYQLDQGRWVKVNENYVEQIDLRHKCFGLQFPFFAIDRIEHLPLDLGINHKCPLCTSIPSKPRYELVEHMMRAHALFNTRRFKEKLMWLNSDGKVLQGRFKLTDTQIQSINRIGVCATAMAGFWNGVEDALHFSQKAKKTLGSELLDMVTSQTRQQALFNILKNGKSEGDAFKKAIRDCFVFNTLYPGIQFSPSHLESIQIRKGENGGSGVVKADIYIVGIKDDKLVYNEIREVRAKGGQGNRPNDIAHAICGEASACIMKTGKLTKFVIECDVVNVPTFFRMAQKFSDYYGDKELHLGEWRGHIPSELRKGGYATWLEDGTRAWMQVQPHNKAEGRYRVLLQIWKLENKNYSLPDFSSSFFLEFAQISRSVLEYNAFAEQSLIVICGLCGVKRHADRDQYRLYQSIWNRQSWSKEFERLVDVLDEIDHLLYQTKQIDANKMLNVSPQARIAPKWDEAKINSAKVKIRGNVRVLQLVLRAWPNPVDVEEALKRFHIKPQIQKLSIDRVRAILEYLFSSKGEPVTIMKEIVKILKDNYVFLYYKSKFVPFGKRVNRNRISSPQNPAYEVLAGLRVITAQANEILGICKKTGKINDGDVESHWETLHAWLNYSPAVVEKVNEILDWLVDLVDR